MGPLSRVTIALILALPAQAHADCGWGDKAGLDAKFDAYITAKAPSACKPFDFSGYHGLRNRGSELVFEIVLRTDTDCFEKIGRAIEAAPIQCGAHTATNIVSYPDADKGPTMMFYFEVTPAEIEEAEGYGQ